MQPDDECGRERVLLGPQTSMRHDLTAIHAKKTSGRTASPGCKRDLPLDVGKRRTVPDMTPHEFEARIVEWARSRPDVKALVLAGSRGGANAVDQWSDWDFHLITTRPRQYYQTNWLTELAPVWCANAELTPRGVIKVSAVFDGGLEADFVPLAAWQMRLVYFAMRRPEWINWMPARLHLGIEESRAFLLGSGYKILLGGKAWEKRLSALDVPWTIRRMSADEFTRHVAAFWQKAVWLTKKIVRPEPRSAMHWLHRLVIEHVYALLVEEARLAGCPARPEARKAEKWLNPRRLSQTAIETGTDQRVLAQALLSQILLFEEVCQSVAGSRGWVTPDYSAVAAWIRQELTKLLFAP